VGAASTIDESGYRSRIGPIRTTSSSAACRDAAGEDGQRATVGVLDAAADDRGVVRNGHADERELRLVEDAATAQVGGGTLAVGDDQAGDRVRAGVELEHAAGVVAAK
jgi:hypothetical protein